MHVQAHDEHQESTNHVSPPAASPQLPAAKFMRRREDLLPAERLTLDLQGQLKVD
jgi:hypothetical protein